MAKIQLVHRCLLSGAISLLLAAVPGVARAAVPKPGAWESGSRSQPRVSFDVRGPSGRRTVRRLSFPITCRGESSYLGWGRVDTIASVRRGGRFRAFDFDYALRGRFTAKGRAVVTVRSPTDGNCAADRRRYVVLRRPGGRIVVRTGSYLAHVGVGAVIGLETTAFGRMVRIDHMQGTVPADCSDGSRRQVTLAGPQDVVLAAPIAPGGHFGISATAATSSIAIAGNFDRGTLGAYVDQSVVDPDGTTCTVPTQPLVGAFAWPASNGGEAADVPAPPLIVLRSGLT